MTPPPTLPLTDDELRATVDALGITAATEDQPFFATDGTWAFDPLAGWPRTWWLSPRLADWREQAHPRYEGLEDADLAADALARGELPGHLCDEEAQVEELFKDNGGNVYLRFPAIRTADGHTPIFFFDHNAVWKVKAVARTLPQLYGRRLLAAWQEEHGHDDAVQGQLDAPIPLDPASVAGFGDQLADGWREAVGLPPRDAPLQRRSRVVQDVVEGAALGDIETLVAFQEAYTHRFILADRVDAAALPDVLRPLDWWNEQPFPDLDAALRNLMARVAALAHKEASEGTDRYRAKELLAGAQLLDGLLQSGRVELRPYQNPEDVLRDTCGAALEVLVGERHPWGDMPEDDGVRYLDEVRDMKAFHAGWADIVPAEVLAQGDVVAFRTASALLQHLSLMKNTIYNLVRRCGDEHIEVLSELVPALLPADQVMVLHGLDNFPKHPGVLALYDRVLAETAYGYVRESVGRYRERVARGVMPSGWET